VFPELRPNWSEYRETWPPPLPTTWIVSEMSPRSPWIRFFELGPIASVSVPPFCVPRYDGRVKSDENLNSVSFANSNDSVIFVMNRLISTYARRNRSSSPVMSKTDSGLPPFASRFAFSSSSRTTPSLLRSSQLKKMSALIPP